MSSRDASTAEACAATVDLLVAIRQAAAGRGHRRSLLAVTGLDLPGTERWILHAVPDGFLVPMSHVARSVGATLPMISRACTRLTEAGLMVRLPDPRDGRRMLVGLTDRTTDALAQWSAQWPERYLEAVADWSREEVLCLDEWLRLVTTHVLDTGLPHASPPRTSPAGAAPHLAHAHLRQLRATIETLVPSAGRMDLAISADPRTGDPLSSSLLHLLLTIAGSEQPATATELAASMDIDAALARRRLQTLTDRRLVTTRGEDHDASTGGRKTYRATPAGHELVDHFLQTRASQLPVPPARLVENGLAQLVARFLTTLTTGSGYAF